MREVFRVLGYRDLIALVGPELQGLGIPEYMDHRGPPHILGSHGNSFLPNLSNVFFFNTEE